MTDEVKVEQIDREAAGEFYYLPASSFSEGDRLVRAFARHRLKAIAEKQESQDGL